MKLYKIHYFNTDTQQPDLTFHAGEVKAQNEIEALRKWYLYGEPTYRGKWANEFIYIAIYSDF